MEGLHRMKRGLGENHLSLRNTTCLKGILAICIILCHLWGRIATASQHLTERWIWHTIGRVCGSLGYLSVALFFFVSGYGLAVQYKNKGEEYMRGFLQKRVLPLYVVSVCLVAFYSGVKVLFGEEILLVDIIQSFLFGGTLIKYGWYLQAILLLYILFYLAFKWVKKDILQILIFASEFLLYLAICLLLKLGSTWYESAFCLVIGVVWGRFNERINTYLGQKKLLAILTLLSLLLFGVTFIFGNFSFFGDGIRILIKCISACSFALLVVLLLRVIPIDNVVTYFLGKISLEIYALHGFALMLYRCKWVYVSNEILYSIFVIATSIGLAFAIHPLFSMILKFGKKG